MEENTKENMKETLGKNALIKPLQTGKIVEGKVIGTGRSSLFLDLGGFGTGIIYGKEFYDAKDELKGLNPGDSLFAKIVEIDNEEGYVELSVSEASNQLTWERLKEKKDKGELIKVKILNANKGGLMAEISNVPAFLPVSQLSPEHYPRVENGDGEKILQEIQKFVGEELEVKIFDIDPKQKKLIISEKAKENEKIKESLKKYKLGDVVDGEITGITDFGVFIKFGEENLEGLIHISELDWQLIENPSDIVKIGEKIKAKIINISDERVSLSLKALKKDPWEGIEEKYKKGDIAEGKVNKINPYGAFVQLEPKIQGLCHVSEFETQPKMEEKIQAGNNYKFQILSIDPKEHRMTLKLAEAEK